MRHSPLSDNFAFRSKGGRERANGQSSVRICWRERRRADLPSSILRRAAHLSVHFGHSLICWPNLKGRGISPGFFFLCSSFPPFLPCQLNLLEKHDGKWDQFLHALFEWQNWEMPSTCFSVLGAQHSIVFGIILFSPGFTQLQGSLFPQLMHRSWILDVAEEGERRAFNPRPFR